LSESAVTFDPTHANPCHHMSLTMTCCPVPASHDTKSSLVHSTNVYNKVFFKNVCKRTSKLNVVLPAVTHKQRTCI